MLNKQTKVLAIVLAVLLSGVIGFALFSQQIEINGTAKAEGKFDVTATCRIGATAEEIEGLGLYAEKGYENDTCVVSNSNHQVDLSVDLNYPGAARNFIVKMTNTGTIDAQFNGHTYPLIKVCAYGENGEEECYEETNVTEFPTGVTSYTMGFDKFEFLAVGDGDNIYHMYDEAEMVAAEEKFNFDEAMIFKPGQSLYVLIPARMHKVLGGSNNNDPFNIKTNLSIKFDFVQAQ